MEIPRDSFSRSLCLPSHPPSRASKLPWKTQRLTAFQPIAQPSIPLASENLRAIDAFVPERLRQQNLSPAPPANRKTLIRRLYHDLHGLKPTLEEIDRFVEDKSPQAYSELIDRLLSSPRFGERWGRHWLDAARYADTKGYLAGGESRSYPSPTPTEIG